MPRARYPAFTFLWLLATTGAFGKVKLILPDHIIVEQPTLIPWSRAGEGTVINYGMRTVPPIEFQAGAFQIDSVAGLSGTVTIVFHESPTGFVALEVFDKNNVSTVHGNSTAFKIFNADGSTGSQGTTTSTSSSSADSPGAASTETPSGPSSIHHVAARVIAGAVFGSLTLLGLLAGILLWLRRRKWHSTDPFSSTIENSPIPNEKLLPNPTYPLRQNSTSHMTDDMDTESAGVGNRRPDTRANRTIEEMAATMQRMESEIVRLNHQMLPPVYSIQ